MRKTKVYRSKLIMSSSNPIVNYLNSSSFNIEDFVNKVDEDDPMMDLVGDSFRREVVRQVKKFLIEHGYSKYDLNSPEVRHLLEHMARGYGEIY